MWVWPHTTVETASDSDISGEHDGFGIGNVRFGQDRVQRGQHAVDVGEHGDGSSHADVLAHVALLGKGHWATPCPSCRVAGLP